MADYNVVSSWRLEENNGGFASYRCNLALNLLRKAVGEMIQLRSIVDHALTRAASRDALGVIDVSGDPIRDVYNEDP
ncbi:hypothetical protein GCM10028856_27830 [Halopiger thermotolerans]